MKLELTSMYVPVSYRLQPISHWIPQDNNRVISFSEGRAHLTSCHFKVDHLDAQVRPASDLLTDHLAQGVFRWCLFPRLQSARHRQTLDLDSVDEAIESPFSVEEEQINPDDLSARMEYLTLSQGREDEKTTARLETDVYGLEGWEQGDGKAAFENYLTVALDHNDDGIPVPFEYN
jgi:hypothetical protein